MRNMSIYQATHNPQFIFGNDVVTTLLLIANAINNNWTYSLYCGVDYCVSIAKAIRRI